MIRSVTSIGVFFLLLASCKNKEIKIQPAKEKITESVYASGIVKSKNQYQVFASVNGIVTKVFVSEGDLVKKGTPLMMLSNITAQLNTENAKIAADYALVSANSEKLNELKLNIELAKIKMDNDASLLERQKNLWTQQIGTRNELDQRELAYKSSVTTYNAAKLEYTELQKKMNFQEQQAQKNLQISKTAAGDYTIKSEADGRVYSVLKEQGEMVTIQSPVALVGDDNAFLLELQVDEYDIARIKAGQKIVLSMDSYKGQVFEAIVKKVYPFMTEQTRSFTIEADFVKQPPALYPNLTCEANIVVQEKEKALTIPRGCLLEGDYVLLASKEKRKVVTGLKDYQKVEIVDGLTANDIILKPAQ